MSTPAPAVTHLLYLHGFRSSPQSFKAHRLAAWVAQQRPDLAWWCPQLPPAPGEAWALIEQGIAAWPREAMAVVGSSLGGYYATAVAQATGCRGVLLNPAVAPARDLATYIGEQTHYHRPQESFVFRPEYIAQLQALHAGPLRWPQRLLAIIAKGDEVLSWQEMQARYAACPTMLLDGSDHALSDFDAHLPQLLGFLGLAPAAAGGMGQSPA